ncbi:glycosyl transferase group 1 [Natronolimnohabitans innermongolicus JCM 12255]|uniref:Glycosyl transferase group 1 n=2 Tax=Natronolimnohabitans innermongolicus TaxID=253107 RepID=L9WI96_9EURY|nr:glycosyl transferase group 1 [Natronolimnohabitans innermongolicus JCM 12255]
MANVEAMAAGLPVATTSLEDIRTYLTNGHNGLLARVGDPRDLADKLAMVLENPQLRRQLGQQAREDVRATFTWDEQARRLERFCYETFDLDEPKSTRESQPISTTG